MTKINNSPFVEVNQKENYVVLNLVSKKDLNALSLQRLSELKTILKEFESHPNIRVIFFKSNFERGFISGADLNELNQQNQFDIYNSEFQKFMLYLRNYPKLTVSLLNGMVYGGGFELALACDFRICSSNVDVRLPETTLGIMPGGGGTQLLPLLIGESLAKQIVILNKSLDQNLLEKYGLVFATYDFIEFDYAIEKITKNILKGAPKAQELSKLAIQSQSNIETGTLVESLSQSILFSSDDKKEGMNSFLNKNTPNYKGE